MSQPPPQKFAFDNDFFDVTVAGAPVTSGMSASGSTAQAKLEEKLQAAHDDGYAAGQADGRAQATATAALEVAELKNQLLALTASVSEAQTAWQLGLQQQLLGLTRLTLHHLVGHAAEHYPDQLLEHYLKDLVPQLRTSEELHLRLHPQARGYHEKLGLPQASIGGRAFQIIPDPSLGPADVVVEWRQGGLETRLSDVLARLDQLLAAAGATHTEVPPPPQATGFTPAPEAPVLAAAAAPESPLSDIEDANRRRADALLGDDQ